MVPDLSRILALATYLDDPQLSYPTIHVTGTNGKGTAARVATEIACAHGLTTGLYTSPHLMAVTERLSVCGVDMTAAGVRRRVHAPAAVPRARRRPVRGARDLLRGAHGARLPLVRRQAGRARGVRGGHGRHVGRDEPRRGRRRRDHPDRARPPGARRHPRPRSRARRPASSRTARGRRARAGPRGARRARGAVRRRSVRRCCSSTATGRSPNDCTPSAGRRSSVRGRYATYDELFLPLFGEHAVRNAGGGDRGVRGVVRRGARRAIAARGARRRAVARAARGGRRASPSIVLDGAHNPAGAEALAAALREFFPWERLHLVVSISANKDVAGIARAARPARRRRLRGAQRERAHRRRGPDRRGVRRPRRRRCTTHGTVAEALDAARARPRPSDLICVTGSLYTVADARRALGLAG